jgi:anti-sigma regulatory factor (Ser/Thr protein kinase)
VRSGAACDHAGYFHETAFYGSNDEFLSIVVPFVEGGVAAGEPTLVTLAQPNADLVRAAMPIVDGVTFVPGEARYRTPATTIRIYRETFAALVAQGATQIRVVGDVPHPGFGVPWDSWARYEAVVNHAYDDFPVWGLCPYDTRTAPAFVLDEVARTHRHIADANGRHHANAHFTDPVDFLGARITAADPIETTQPDLELVDPTPGQARHALGAVVAATLLDEDEIHGLDLAVSEAVTNALVHGEKPVSFRVWAPTARRVVVTVNDRGPGPADPFVGLVPPQHRGPGGLGLWIAHQTCTDVAMRRDADGFTVRLLAGELGNPAPSPFAGD